MLDNQKTSISLSRHNRRRGNAELKKNSSKFYENLTKQYIKQEHDEKWIKIGRGWLDLDERVLSVSSASEKPEKKLLIVLYIRIRRRGRSLSRRQICNSWRNASNRLRPRMFLTWQSNRFCPAAIVWIPHSAARICGFFKWQPQVATALFPGRGGQIGYYLNILSGTNKHTTHSRERALLHGVI